MQVAMRSHLLRLRNSLPLALETSRYNFNRFSLDVDWIQDAGEEAAINRELEVILGSRAKGLVLPERGPGVVAVANVLENFIQSFLNPAPPTLWPEDITRAAEASVVAAGLQADWVIHRSCRPSLTEKPPVLERDSEDLPESVQEHESDKESGDGLTWLDGPPPHLDAVERRVFNTVDVAW
ncbi:hypothetical protein BJV78DRAFT_1176133 [Lactifluus subvellereus]|nr:hypothetical protein BJV78DRAFT_1176133 [Lactifluus subvellereus]